VHASSAMSEFDNRFNEALNGLLKSIVGLEKTHRRMKSFEDLVQQQADIDESKSIEDLSGELTSLGLLPAPLEPSFSDSSLLVVGSCKEEILKGHAGLCRHRWQLLRDLRIHRPLTDLEKLAVNTASSVARKNGACADVLGLFLESRGHLDEARDMFKQGADLGNASAALDAGRLYMDGPMRDLAKASRYLKRAAKRAEVAR
jgi:TPR repeat protein